VLTASEVLVSITALEFSYKQAPLRMKSFIMALFLLSTSVGNAMTAGVNAAMVRPLHATAAEVGAETWISLDDVTGIIPGQKIDFANDSGVKITARDGKSQALKGTFLVAATDADKKRVRLMDVVDRQPIVSVGTFDAAKADVTTYKLVGPQYFNFFAMAMAAVGVLFVFVAYFYKEKDHLRKDDDEAPAT
jgi:POT family proton-dependent oligopeptide transporter